MRRVHVWIINNEPKATSLIRSSYSHILDQCKTEKINAHPTPPTSNARPYTKVESLVDENTVDIHKKLDSLARAECPEHLPRPHQKDTKVGTNLDEL